MEISRDVFLTDGRNPHFTVSIASRDLTGHRLLTGLDDAEREALRQLLADHAQAVQSLLRTAWARQEPDATTNSFGCGT